MLLDDFLRRLEKGKPTERAEIAAALARVYIGADLDAPNRRDALTALTLILDDPAPVVRRALSVTLCESQAAPLAILRTLAADTAEVALPVLMHSPVFGDAELVDIVGAGGGAQHRAIAMRRPVSVAVAAAVAEIAGPPACVELLQNRHARISSGSLRRLVSRHRGDAEVREALLGRDDLPFDIRRELVEGLVGALSEFLVSREWLTPEHAKATLDDAYVAGMMRMAAENGSANRASAAHRLEQRGLLNDGLILRAICTGEEDFAIACLGMKARLPDARSAQLYRDPKGAGFAVLCRRAGIAETCIPVFEAAARAAATVEDLGGDGGRIARMQRIVERAMSAAEESEGAASELAGLLIRISAELARSEARAATGGYFRAA
ncbi:MAG: DUF2336 domain-containing protein [Flavobacteriaceae bacterium]